MELWVQLLSEEFDLVVYFDGYLSALYGHLLCALRFGFCFLDAMFCDDTFLFLSV